MGAEISIKKRSTEEMVLYLTGQLALIRVDCQAIRDQYMKVANDHIPKENYNRLVRLLAKKLELDKKTVEKIRA